MSVIIGRSLSRSEGIIRIRRDDGRARALGSTNMFFSVHALRINRTLHTTECRSHMVRTSFDVPFVRLFMESNMIRATARSGSADRSVSLRVRARTTDSERRVRDRTVSAKPQSTDQCILRFHRA